MAKRPHAMRAWVILAVGGLVMLVLIAALQSRDTAPETSNSGRAANLATFGVADDPYLGDPDARVVLVEFASPACSNCRAFHASTLPGLVEDHIDPGDVVYYYVHARLGYSWELDAAMAQECALREEGRDLFWAVTDAVYAPANFSYSAPPDFRVLLEQVTERAGAELGAVLRCFDEREGEQAIRRDWEAARDAGVVGTPTFFIFGSEGPATAVRAAALDAALAAAVQDERSAA